MSGSLTKFAAAWVISLLALAIAMTIVFSPRSSAAQRPALSPSSVTLPEIDANTDKALPVDTAEPNIPCADFQTRLERYDTMARQHDASLSTFLGDVTNKLTAWYDLLVPLEGSAQTIPSGVFLPLQDGANKITTVTDLAFENSALLANEMDRLIHSLKECTLTGKPLTP
jgi:hypothetical protein